MYALSSANADEAAIFKMKAGNSMVSHPCPQYLQPTSSLIVDWGFSGHYVTPQRHMLISPGNRPT